MSSLDERVRGQSPRIGSAVDILRSVGAGDGVASFGEDNTRGRKGLSGQCALCESASLIYETRAT